MDRKDSKYEGAPSWAYRTGRAGDRLKKLWSFAWRLRERGQVKHLVRNAGSEPVDLAPLGAER